jgi:hypothetical protein
MLVKHPAEAVQRPEAKPADAPAPEPSSPARRSSRKRDGRAAGEKDETAAAVAAPTQPQRAASPSAGRGNRAGKLSVDDF